MKKDDLFHLIETFEKEQMESLLCLGRRLVPNLTSEDMLQPNDYPILETHPEFRYEEGVLAGMRALKIAIYALSKE